MSNASLEAQVARVSGQLEFVIKDMEASSASRLALHQSMEEQGKVIVDLLGRLKNIEREVANAQPTIQEFITIKHKVVGAGLFGRWIWIIFAALIGFVAASREAIFKWFQG